MEIRTQELGSQQSAVASHQVPLSIDQNGTLKPKVSMLRALCRTCFLQRKPSAEGLGESMITAGDAKHFTAGLDDVLVHEAAG